MTPRLKIAVLGSLAESLVTFRGALLQAMVAGGHRVIACSPAAPYRVVETLAGIGIEHREVPLDRAGLNPVRDLKAVAALYRLFREIAPDILLSYTAKPVIYGSLAARLAGVPSICSMITGLGYGFVANGFKARSINAVLRTLYRTSLRYNQTVFFQNPDDRDVFLNIGLVPHTTRIVLINGSGVDLQVFRPVPFPPGISFLLIGRLLTLKGVREYAAAARIVKARHPDARFRLAGWIDGTPDAIDESELKAWIDDGALEFLGRLDDVRPAIADASVYVLPSFREGTPRTVLEAMAMGRPIITTNAPGCRETVVGGVNGFLVPTGDVAALVDAMERFIKTPSLVETMGRESRRIATEKYDVHKVNMTILQAMGVS